MRQQDKIVTFIKESSVEKIDTVLSNVRFDFSKPCETNDRYLYIAAEYDRLDIIDYLVVEKASLFSDRGISYVFNILLSDPINIETLDHVGKLGFKPSEDEQVKHLEAALSRDDLSVAVALLTYFTDAFDNGHLIGSASYHCEPEALTLALNATHVEIKNDDAIYNIMQMIDSLDVSLDRLAELIPNAKTVHTGLLDSEDRSQRHLTSLHTRSAGQSL